MALRLGGGDLIIRRALGTPAPVQGFRLFGSPLYGARLASPVAGTVLLRAGDGALSLRLVTAGPQSLALPFLASGVALYAPVVSLSGGGAQSLSLPFLASSGVLYAPLVAPGAVALGLPFLASGAVLFAPVVAPGAVALGLPFLPAGNGLFAPSLALGAVGLGLPFLATGAALYAPVVAPGAVALGLPFLADANLLFSPFVTLPTIPPAKRVALVVALARAARVEGLPRIGALGASARIILIK
jgi:hypothetical protein